MKILVVHRQPEFTELVKTAMAHVNPYIRFTSSGYDGLVIARIEEFDLVICGTDLPLVSGFELVRAMRLSSVNDKTTVVFVADIWKDGHQSLANALGAAGRLTSQTLSNSLASLVEESMERRRFGDGLQNEISLPAN